MKFEIKHRFNGAVLFSLECESLRVCVESAVKARADLAGADLTGANLARANLTDAYLAGADLAGANLARADLAGADLTGAYLARADLAGADLTDAYLAGADLTGANLARANLTDAYLAGADLAGANLARADLAGADLTDAYLAAQLGQPDGWHAWTYFDTKLNEQRVQVGCQNKTIDEGRAYCYGKTNRTEVMAALDYAEEIGKSRGWNSIKKENA